MTLNDAAKTSRVANSIVDSRPFKQCLSQNDIAATVARARNAREDAEQERADHDEQQRFMDEAPDGYVESVNEFGGLK